VLATTVVATTTWLRRSAITPSSTPAQFTLSVETQANASPNTFPVPSPDGRSFVFAGGRVGAPPSLWLRAVDASQPMALPGTEGASDPVWSPDSQWIAFYAHGQVKKVRTTGDAPQTLAEAPGFLDAAWGSRGDILFRPSNRAALFRLRDSGGVPRAITTLDPSLEQNSHRGPVFLPDGVTFLFTSRCAERANNALYVASLESRAVTRLMPIQSVVRYIHHGSGTSDTVLYYRDGGLVAHRFNAEAHQLSGTPVPVVDRVDYNASSLTLGFTVSEDGRLAVLRRQAAELSRLTWFDRTGVAIGTVGEAGTFLQPRISPDGTRVAVTRPDTRTGNRDVWVIEIARGITSRLTTHVANDWFPVWSPDGRHLLFGSDRNGGLAMRPFLKQALDVASDEMPFSLADQEPYDWSRDGKWIAYAFDDVLIAPAAGAGKPFAFLATPFHEGDPRFSPDGRWIAYVSDETGEYEVYVRPFTGGPAAAEGKIQISNNGGDFPVWRNDGQELYYMADDFTVYAVDTRGIGRSPVMPLPTKLFRACPGTLPIATPMRGQLFAYNFDTREGTRFLVNCATESPGRFDVLLDWPLTTP
jgi:Tol biopolymer transport system component